MSDKNEDLTTLDSLSEEAKSAADDTVSPDLVGKYDDEPFFQEKIDRANYILETFGIPDFSEKTKKH